MDDILLTAALRQRGLDDRDLLRLQRRGELTRIRRGAYAVAPAEPLSRANQHRQLVLATVPQLGPGAVISHGSAAVLHGLPFWPEAVERVHVTRNRSTGARRRSLVEVHGAALSPDALTVIDGVTTTSLTRTVLDLGRTWAFEQAVAAGDRALALGLARDELLAASEGMDHWRGIRQARRVIGFLDGRSESAGESVSRVRMADDGLPKPELQTEVFGPDERLLARLDFCWEEQQTIGEFDGKIKYGRLLKPGQRIEDVIFAEKQREDALRDLGWQVVRWLWADLYRPGVIRDRVLRAFARAGHRPHTA